VRVHSSASGSTSIWFDSKKPKECSMGFAPCVIDFGRNGRILEFTFDTGKNNFHYKDKVSLSYPDIIAIIFSFR
jgi:hypothetical protein